MRRQNAKRKTAEPDGTTMLRPTYSLDRGAAHCDPVLTTRWSAPTYHTTWGFRRRRHAMRLTIHLGRPCKWYTPRFCIQHIQRIYIYIYMYVIYIYIYISLSIYIYICIYVCTYIYIYIYTSSYYRYTQVDIHAAIHDM